MHNCTYNAVFSVASMQGLAGVHGLGGVWVHIKGLTCHIKEIPHYLRHRVGGGHHAERDQETHCNALNSRTCLRWKKRMLPEGGLQ